MQGSYIASSFAKVDCYMNQTYFPFTDQLKV